MNRESWSFKRAFLWPLLRKCRVGLKIGKSIGLCLKKIWSEKEENKFLGVVLLKFWEIFENNGRKELCCLKKAFFGINLDSRPLQGMKAAALLRSHNLIRPINLIGVKQNSKSNLRQVIVLEVLLSLLRSFIVKFYPSKDTNTIFPKDNTVWRSKWYSVLQQEPKWALGSGSKNEVGKSENDFVN